jgi:Tfp pilus assembly protein PilF
MNDRHGSGVSIAAFVCLGALLFSSGCSLPRIIILKDPLSAEEHIRLGSIYQNQGKIDLAEQQYREAVHKDSKSVHALRLLGDLSFTVKKYSEAESAYKKAIKLQPQDGDLYNNLCWVYLERNIHIDWAEELIEKAIAATPDHQPYYLDTKGIIFLKQGKNAEATAEFLKAIALLPADRAGFQKEIYKHLAEAYRAAGDTAKAVDAQEQGARCGPGN